LQIAAIEQQQLLEHPRPAQLCDLYRTRRFGNLVAVPTSRAMNRVTFHHLL
jgi:hypothetical protein